MKMTKGVIMEKGEAVLRILAVLVLVLTAFLVGFDTQTQVVLFRKKATFKDMDALYVWVYVFSIAGGYNLLRLCNISSWFQANLKLHNLGLAWAAFFFDQIAAYVTFGANTAATQASIIAVTGQNDFQWMKLCDKFTRFCIQIGGAIMCGYIACFLMFLIASFSAFNLFRLYSPKKFLLLKPL